MVGVFVAFIRVVYGRTIYMSLPLCWRNIYKKRTIGTRMKQIVTKTGSKVIGKPRNSFLDERGCFALDPFCHCFNRYWKGSL